MQTPDAHRADDLHEDDRLIPAAVAGCFGKTVTHGTHHPRNSRDGQARVFAAELAVAIGVPLADVLSAADRIEAADPRLDRWPTLGQVAFDGVPAAPLPPGATRPAPRRGLSVAEARRQIAEAARG